jgi:ubiquinone biosynthesis protein UbiJ
MTQMDNKRLNKIIKAVESAINTALAMDPIAQKHLKRLKDCTLAINISAPGKLLYVGVEEHLTEADPESAYRVTLLGTQNQSDVEIKGRLLSFIKLAATSDKNTLLRTKEIQMSGDSIRIQQIQAFLSVVRVDWEGILSSVIGDIPAHIIGTSLRHGLSFGLNLGQSLIRDAEEFIKYELRLFPNKAVANKQFTAINKLQEASDKLEQKIKARLKTNKRTGSKAYQSDQPIERD